MTDVLVDHAPRVRCHECGDGQVFAVCHHCQRPMCAEHSPLVLRQGSVLVREPTGTGDEARPVSKELAGLRLGSLREAVYHCRDHDHLVRAYPLLWVVGGAGAVALGFLLMFVSVSFGLVPMLIGAAVAGGAILLHRFLAAGTARPLLPLVPQVNTVDIVERLTGYVRLEKGEYSTAVESVTGEMTIDMSANDGRTVLNTYRKKFGVPHGEPVPFSGGYLMLEGDAGLAFRAGQPAVLVGGTGISLGGESADGHDLFPTDADLSQREATLVVDYEVQDGRSPREMPLWIVPSLVPSSDRRTLEIDLHWNHLGPDDRQLQLAVFDLVELEVPAGWGSVESFAPGRVAVGRAGGRRTIQWKQLRPNRREATSLTLLLRFERPITEVPESAAGAAGSAWSAAGELRTRLTLAGRVEATFDGLLSGVEGVGVYLPGGGRGHHPPTKTQTKVTVGFDVSLRSLRYQDERLVPDGHHADDRTYNRNRPDEFHGVVPDFQTISELTDAISADSYYVKSIVEHPPFRVLGRQNVVNRVWDITGRLYTGLFPIDFDISLRGEEIGTQSVLSGKTVAQVTVKGAYAMGTLVDSNGGTEGSGAVVETDAPDDELLKKIEDTWTSLRSRVNQILAARAGRATGTHSIGSAEPLIHGEVIDAVTDSVLVMEADPLAAPVSGAATAEPVTGKVVADAATVVELRRQRASADEARRAGWISDENHRRIVTGIEDELRGMGES